MHTREEAIRRPSEVILPDFIVKNTFIEVPKAPRPVLRRVSSDSSLLHSDCLCNWAEADIASEILADEDNFEWTETASVVTEDDFDDVFERVEALRMWGNGACMQNGAVDTTHLDSQATHWQPQAQNAGQITQFVRCAAQIKQLKSEAQDAMDLAQQAHQAVLMTAQTQEARLRELCSTQNKSASMRKRDPSARAKSTKNPQPSLDPLLYALCC